MLRSGRPSLAAFTVPSALNLKIKLNEWTQNSKANNVICRIGHKTSGPYPTPLRLQALLDNKYFIRIIINISS